MSHPSESHGCRSSSQDVGFAETKIFLLEQTHNQHTTQHISTPLRQDVVAICSFGSSPKQAIKALRCQGTLWTPAPALVQLAEEEVPCGKSLAFVVEGVLLQIYSNATST